MAIGSTAHNAIRSWKKCLRGTILTKINNNLITSKSQMIEVIKKLKQTSGSSTVRIEFGSIKGFAMNGAGIPVLQADQLNVIAHHINAIKIKENNFIQLNLNDIYKTLWNDPLEWPDNISKEQIKMSKLTRQKIMKEEDEITKAEFK